MPKNYYLVLGITSDATMDDIKEAYRRLAKEYHPDHYGENHSPFLAIQEAYSVLSDPIKRQRHDLSMINRKRTSGSAFCQTPLRSGTSNRVETLIPKGRDRTEPGVTSLTRSFHSYRPSMAQLFDRIISNFTITSRPNDEGFENLNIVIPLTAEQAFSGGRVRIDVPVESVCSSFSGMGWVGPYGCRRCVGEEIIPGKYPVMISYPPGISNSHIAQMPLDAYGIGNLYLTVHFKVRKML